MTLETISQFAGILSALCGVAALFGLKILHKNIINQNNKQNINVEGDAIFEGSFNVSNKVDPIKE